MESRPLRMSEIVKPLSTLSSTFLHFTEAGNDRLTVNQVAFFLIAAAADAAGKPMTVTEIMESANGIINPSVANTYKVLLDSKNNKDYRKIGLGWLRRETDPDDARRNYLRLTKIGQAVVSSALQAANR